MKPADIPSTVLLADDEQILLISYRDYLEDCGFRVIAVEDAAGVERHAAESDILVVDVRLPTERLEGLEVIAKLIASDALAPRIPVIFMSVLSEDDDISQKKLQEFSQLRNRYLWLQKPFEGELLAKKIRDQMAASR